MNIQLLQKDELFIAGRRTFLRRGSGFMLTGAAVALLAGNDALAATAAKAAKGGHAGDVAILNGALGAEQQAIAAYQVGAESGLLQKPVLDLAVKFQSQHKAHADLLAATVKQLGGTAVAPKANYDFPVASLKTQADVLRFAAGLEQGAVSAYLAAIPKFDNRDLSKAAGSILGDEAMHWAILRNALGEDPVPAAFVG
ncbi:MAG: ferritin-like domain-containing protein [Casimicrobiaceae bacterium]